MAKMKDFMNYEKAQETAGFIKSKYAKDIKVALVLGGGLGAFAEEVENKVVITVRRNLPDEFDLVSKSSK